MVHQFLGLSFPPFSLVLSQNGNKSLRKGPFAKYAALKVGELEGHEEGIGVEPGPKGTGDQHVPDKPEHAGYHGHAADRKQGFEQIHWMAVRVAGEWESAGGRGAAC